MPVGARVHNPLTLLAPASLSSNPVGFTLISSTIETTSVRQAHAIECAAFTLRVAQMETATLATTAGEKNPVEGETEPGELPFVFEMRVTRSI